MPDFNYRNLAYTGPETGGRIEFVYDGVLEDGRTHNLGAFQFAGKDEKYFQDRSISSDGYGFQILLNDQDALRETRLLLDEKVTQNNPGILEHPDPTIGTVQVVTASYKVEQNTVRGIGVIRVSVIFFKQIPNLIGGDPAESNNPASAAATQREIDELNIDQAEDFESSVNLTTGRGFAALVERTTDAVQKAVDSLGSIAARVDEVNVLFTNTAAEILSTADELARAPFDLARQVQNLIQLPALAADSVRDRITAYREYVNNTLDFQASDIIEFEAGSPAGANILSVAGMSAIAAVSAINYSAVSGQSITLDQIRSGEAADAGGYLSRIQVIDTINAVLDSARETTYVLTELASDFGASSFFSQYFDYSILNKQLVTTTVRNLNQRIFSTSQEKIYVTIFEENIVPLCARLYGSVEANTVQFLQESNKIHGDEIWTVPKGKEIVYYG